MGLVRGRGECIGRVFAVQQAFFDPPVEPMSRNIAFWAVPPLGRGTVRFRPN